MSDVEAAAPRGGGRGGDCRGRARAGRATALTPPAPSRPRRRRRRRRRQLDVDAATRRTMVRTTSATAPATHDAGRIMAISSTDMAEPWAQFWAAWNWLATIAPTMLPVGPAEHRGGDVVARQRDEHEEQPGHDARHGQRQRHLDERAQPAGAEVLAGLPQRRIEPVERHEQREDHERQVVVDDAELHGLAGVEEADRRVAQADRLHPVRQEAVGAEHDAPRDRADQEARPERHDDEAEQHAPPPRRHLHRQPVGEREGDHEAQRRADERDAQRLAEHLEQVAGRARCGSCRARAGRGRSSCSTC